MAIVFETADTLEADFTVYVVASGEEADLLVYEIDEEDGEDTGRIQDWVYADEADEARYVVGYVDEEDEADLKIYFVGEAREAKLLNKLKARLF
ncbi:MAG TPA: hypothetical protein ENJ82_00970 [Bacteroidetes bacterium]|nr:hypothetical protein [Bacteroidota bacterium]